MIVKSKSGFKVVAKELGKNGKHKNLGAPYKTRGEALKRLRAVEWFKRNKG